MIWAFLSTRLRTWVLVAVLLPLFGRVLERAAPKVAARNPRAGDVLGKAGGWARDPRGTRRRPDSRGGTSPAPR